MKFTFFKFKNFKGIKDEIFDFSKNKNSNVFTLVGLNESGKTTILEAINYFAYKPEDLGVLELDNYSVNDIHNLIPINRRDNFNDCITIEAGIELDSNDIELIKNEFKENRINLTHCGNSITYTQKYYFENSLHVKAKNQFLWSYDFKGTKEGETKSASLSNDDALIGNKIIKENLPSILYFPNFLFEFPEKIYLSRPSEDAKFKFYYTLIQDILDSLDNNTNIKEHIVKRIESTDDNDKRNLQSLIGKMQKQLTTVIFKKWNQVFNKEISNTEIIIMYGKDSNGVYLEFNIKDDVDTYRIIERSLGFRWFFVYILFTQFRTYRKGKNNAFFLFDEPASNLHPSAQMELLKSFEKLPKVIYTTHSHYLINPQWLENTYVIKNEAIDYENEHNFKSKNTDIKINKYREFAVKYPRQSSYFQPILEVLDYRPSNLELVPNVIITEGKNDFYILNYLQNIIFQDKKLLKIVPGTSSSNLESLISLYLGWGVKFCILLDSDKEGKKQKNRYIELFGLSITNLIVTYEDIDKLWTNMEIESFFEDDERIKIQQAYFQSEIKFKKSTFNRSIQELFINKKQIKFSNLTENRFRKILDFLKFKIK